MPVNATQFSITSFTVPVAGGRDTKALGINDNGQTVGTYVDASLTLLGFVRSSDGTLTSFQCVPGGLRQPGNAANFLGINNQGQIAGDYTDNSGNSHGLIRATDGTLTSFDVPVAGAMTFVRGINNLGQIVGYYSKSGLHGFLRNGDGAFSLFDAPGGFGTTLALGINNLGQIVGEYTNANGIYGFIRDGSGTFTGFVPRGDISAINDRGQIAGSFENGVQTHGYVGNSDGTSTSIDVPGTNDTPGVYGATVVSGLNNAGQVVGYSRITTPGHSTSARPFIGLPITGSMLTVYPAALTFSWSVRSPLPYQTIQVGSLGDNLAYSAVAFPRTSAVDIIQSSTTTPGTISVSMTSKSQEPGTSNTSVLITSPTTSSVSVPVTLVIGPPESLHATPTALRFDYTVGSSVPPSQQISVVGGTLGPSFGASVGTSGVGKWLNVSPAVGTSPSNVSVGVNPVGLSPGTYQGTVMLSSADGPANVSVTLNVT